MVYMDRCHKSDIQSINYVYFVLLAIELAILDQIGPLPTLSLRYVVTASHLDGAFIVC